MENMEMAPENNPANHKLVLLENESRESELQEENKRRTLHIWYTKFPCVFHSYLRRRFVLFYPLHCLNRTAPLFLHISHVQFRLCTGKAKPLYM